MEYRANLWEVLDEIVIASKGAYSYDIVYNMPVWLRRFTFERLKQRYESESDDVEKQLEKAHIPNQNKPFKPKNFKFK